MTNPPSRSAAATAAKAGKVQSNTSRAKEHQRPMQVLVVGGGKSLDFQPARRRLMWSAEQGQCRLAEAADTSSAVAAVTQNFRGETSALPDLVLLAQSHPGELSESEVNRLKRWAPLAAVVAILGNWCDGERRTGTPLAGVTRVPWHRFGPEWYRHLECWTRHRCSAWELPATMTDEERVVWSNRTRRPQEVGNSSTSIVLSQPGDARSNWLVPVCQALGWQPADPRERGDARAGAPQVGIWQADSLGVDALRHLAAFARQLNPAPVLAIVGFPRPEDDQRARSAGAASLLAKPLATHDLAAEVRWLLGHGRGIT